MTILKKRFSTNFFRFFFLETVFNCFFDFCQNFFVSLKIFLKPANSGKKVCLFLKVKGVSRMLTEIVISQPGRGKHIKEFFETR